MIEVKIAQVGCGYWGKNLARNFSELGVLSAVVDGDSATAKSMSVRHSVPVMSFDEVLANSEINGISFATPAVTHSMLAKKALAAGKNVYVEKPMALTAVECQSMIEDATRSSRVLMVGHLLQYHPVFITLKRLLEAGELGDLRYLYSNRLSLGKFRTEEDVLWSFAPHDVSMLLSLANRRVTDISGQGSSFLTAGVADVATVQLSFEGGLKGHLFSSWLHPFKEQRLVAIGSLGMAVFEDSQVDWNRKLSIYRHTIDSSGDVPIPKASHAEFVKVPHGEPLKNECVEFVSAISEGRQPLTNGTEGLRVIDVLERASLALQNNKSSYV